jgi:hypothetical protein
MKIRDYPDTTDFTGFRVKSLASSGRLGTVTRLELRGGDRWWWVRWDGDKQENTTFFWNDGDNEVINEIS